MSLIQISKSQSQNIEQMFLLVSIKGIQSRVEEKNKHLIGREVLLGKESCTKVSSIHRVLYLCHTILLTIISEIRGLSKNLIDDHETWTRNFRDPWNEALPKVNPICPLLTDREGDDSYGNHTRMINIQHALLHHQLCWRRPPPCQNDISFHVTFYEIIQLEHKNELQDEIWESGRLHSEHTFKGTQFGSGACRIRESACTVSHLLMSELKNPC